MNEVYGLNIESLTYSAGTQKLKALFTDTDHLIGRSPKDLLGEVLGSFRDDVTNDPPL